MSVDNERGIATGWLDRWALEHLLDGRPLEEAVAAPFEWQEGWLYVLPTNDSSSSSDIE